MVQNAKVEEQEQEQEQESLTPQQLKLHELQTYDISKLERLDLGEASFKNFLEYPKKIINLSCKLPLNSFNDLPVSIQTNIQNQCNDVLQKFSQVKTFKLNQNNPIQQRDNLGSQFEKIYNTFFGNIFPYISYARSLDDNSKEQEEKFDSLVKSLNIVSAETEKSIAQVLTQASSMTDSVRARLGEADGLIKSIEDASAKAGALKQAIHFRDEKEYHRKRAQWWSFGTLLSAVILILYTLLSVRLHEFLGIDLVGDGKEALAWQVQTSKILIFVVFAYLLMLSSRNFMSHKHNMVVNSHRETALHTFDALAKASNQESGARDIILTHASSCIFTPQETGYAKSGAAEGAASLSGTSLVLNVAKKAVGKE